MELSGIELGINEAVANHVRGVGAGAIGARLRRGEPTHGIVVKVCVFVGVTSLLLRMVRFIKSVLNQCKRCISDASPAVDATLIPSV